MGAGESTEATPAAPAGTTDSTADDDTPTKNNLAVDKELLDELVFNPAAVTEDGIGGPTAFRGLPSRIREGLYLGDALVARNPKLLVQLKIRRIVDVSGREEGSSPFAQSGINYLNLTNVTDDADSPINKYFDIAAAYIRIGLMSNEAVLVHGSAGFSRAPALILAYLVKHENMTLREAFELVSRNRPYAFPNFGFWAKLIGYEASVRDGSTSVSMLTVPFKTAVPNGRGGYLRPDVYMPGFEEQLRDVTADVGDGDDGSSGDLVHSRAGGGGGDGVGGSGVSGVSGGGGDDNNGASGAEDSQPPAPSEPVL